MVRGLQMDSPRWLLIEIGVKEFRIFPTMMKCRVASASLCIDIETLSILGSVLARSHTIPGRFNLPDGLTNCDTD